MDIINKENMYKSIVSATNEFFAPVTNVVNFFKNISGVHYQQEEILKKIKNIEFQYEKIAELEQSQVSMSGLITKSMQQHEVIMSSIYKSFNEITKKLPSDVLLSLSSENNVINEFSNYIISNSDLITRELASGDILTNSAAEIGIGNLEVLISHIIKKESTNPYLFGINKGGAFIANYLSHRLGLEEKYLVKCDYRIDLDKIYCENREIDGPIVILDDVSRTGRTLHKVKSYLKNIYPENKMYTMSLIISSEDEDERDIAFDFVDYSPWITRNKKVLLPWSNEVKKTLEAKNYFNDVEMDQIIGRLKLQGD